MMLFARPHFCRVKDLISRHRDGEVHAIRAERFGIAAIRGATDDRTGLRS
jgi:lysophospholipid acyltransferase (LPLAT)-like uncharacterized protein